MKEFAYDRNIRLNLYLGNEVKEISDELREKIAHAYMVIYNKEKRWNEQWTKESTRKVVDNAFEEIKGRTLIISLLYSGNNFIGFNWGVFLENINNFSFERDLPPHLSDYKEMSKSEKATAVEEVMRWLKSRNENTAHLNKETGIIPEFQKQYLFGFLLYETLKILDDRRCNTFFGWTKKTVSAYQIMIGGGWKDIYVFSDNKLCFIGGDVKGPLKIGELVMNPNTRSEGYSIFSE